MSSTPLRTVDVLSRLHHVGVRPTPYDRGHKANCPACGGDGTLRVIDSDGDAQLVCVSNCTEADIVTALGRGRTAKTASKRTSKDSGDGGDGGDGKKHTHSTRDELVKIAAGADFFHTHDEAFASIPVDGHRENWRTNSKAFRQWLSRQFFLTHKQIPSSQAVQDALNIIGGEAVFAAPEYPVATRIAEHEGAIWIDLCDPEWRAVEVSATGWRVVGGNTVPVRFVRRRGMMPLPTPVAGGCINEFRGLVNLPDDAAWVMLVQWLVMALNPHGPYPPLEVEGEAGSAKSTLCQMVRALIDPNQVSLRRPPRTERDLMIAAQNNWIVAFDNLSGIPNWLSDGICVLATEGGFGTRELYSDDEEKLFCAKRPVIYNGIDKVATRSDLVDRGIDISLPVIPEERRCDESDLWRRFDEIRPGVLGALLDAVSGAIRNRPTVTLERMPRMADFAMWAVAAEPELGFAAGTFMAAYTGNQAEGFTAAIESSVIGLLILEMMEEHGEWQGTAKDLLTLLDCEYTDEATRRRREWPKAPRKLSCELRRLAPALRKLGINVDFGRRTKRGKLLTLENKRKRPSPPSPPSPPNADKDLRGDEAVTVGDDAPSQWSFGNNEESQPPPRVNARIESNGKCDHQNPEFWLHRDGRARCPECGKFMGRLPNNPKVDASQPAD